MLNDMMFSISSQYTWIFNEWFDSIAMFAYVQRQYEIGIQGLWRIQPLNKGFS